MGTLTADCPRLDEHCPHKLPSSCRLTSTPNCCACADERQHTTTYRTYIDGVGFVQRGTRWQGYCWFCKVFWDARVAAAGLSPSETKVPEDPDQSEFVEKWFEWYQGYKIVRKHDGTDEKVELIGEALKDADPGFLPRTREEMQSGRRLVLQGDVLGRNRAMAEEAGPHVSIEDALDELLDDASDEESDNDEVYEITSQVPTSEALVSAAQPSANATNNDQTRLDDALAEAQAAVEAAQRVRDRAEARLNNANSELQVVRERLRRIRRQQITAGNFARVFGTREDVNSDDYVSPITSMFVRQTQWDRRNAERQQMLQEQSNAFRNFADVHAQYGPDAREVSADGSTIGPAPFRATFLGDAHTFVHTPIHTSTDGAQTGQGSTQHDTPNPSNPYGDFDYTRYPRNSAEYLWHAEADYIRGILSREEFQLTLADYNHSQSSNGLDALADLPIHEGALSGALQNLRTFRPRPVEPQFAGLDGDSRPDPVKAEDMQRKLECKICLQQVADTACLPCGHLSMCEWCADQWVPTKTEDKTRPQHKGVRCPCCRARVKSRVKIYAA